MRKTILLAAVALVLGTMQVNAQVTFGVKVGLNAAKEIEKGTGGTTKSESLKGLHAGVVAEISISENLFIEPGLLLSRKGGIYAHKFLSTYADLPINLLYKLPLGDGDTKFVGFAGGYAGFLISAKEKVSNQSQDAKDLYNDMDYGINIGAGVEIDKLTLGLQYSIGLANISNVSGISTKNNVFGISIGYKFRKD